MTGPYASIVGRLVRVEYRDGTTVAYDVSPGTIDRETVESIGLPRYVRVRGRWKPWLGLDLDPLPATLLDAVPLARVLCAGVARTPGAFVVDATVWCGWPVAVREQLRATTAWSKRPGVVATDALDATTATCVRNLVAQHGLVGLEEV